MPTPTDSQNHGHRQRSSVRRSGQVYLDHAATHPTLPEAVEAMVGQLQRGGNPSAINGTGRAARRVLEESRDTIAQLLNVDPVEVVFTSGGTEADNLAVKGLYGQRHAEDPRRTRVVISAIEHPAVTESAQWLAAEHGAAVEFLDVDAQGFVDPHHLRRLLEHDPDSVALVAVMWANNEVGTIEPIQDLAAICHEFGVPFHTDAVQAFGAVDVDASQPGISTVAISGHKLGAPVGSGALVVGRSVKLTSTNHGGGQQRSLRSGTLDAAGAAAFAAAARTVTRDLTVEAERLATLRDRLIRGVLQAVPQAVLRGPQDFDHVGTRLPNNAHFTFPGAEGDSLLFLLDAAGFATSTGSACSAGVPRPSTVLLALGLDEDTARGAQRFTLGHGSTDDDVDALLAALPEVYARAKSAGMAGQVSTLH
ncbi:MULTISPECIES: cysteine desulfurase family protein [Kocuria]|uniref:Cysteine desulfurase n=1 Tax=Kocuria subflava TaxID=1736139 RepID=A0A846TPT6_9MICC|nr:MULTISPECIES: cysteine desulfurase family protein [Kocuria]NKE10453.1 cysteine desulfurase [Kocuria subflava]